MKDVVNVWWSSEEEARNPSWFQAAVPIRYKLDYVGSEQTKRPDGADQTTIALDPEQTYQEMLGIGTSIEESTVYNLRQMSHARREEVYRLLVDRSEGAGFNFMRIAFGTSDFTAQPFYSYNDLEQGGEDFELDGFSIQKDIDLEIVATLSRLLEISPDMKIFASPWTPPAWMKTSGCLRRGELKEGKRYTDVYARYLCKAVLAYEAQGIPIYALTLQNEPLLEIDYPSCYMSPERQAELAIALHREFAAHNVDTKIWIFDHNFSDGWRYVVPILNDEQAGAATDGIAFHDYEGEPDTMTEIRSAYPGKSIHLTERSVWGVLGADRIVQYFRNWASSYNVWVTMLDSTIGTHQWVGVPDPTLFVQDATDRDHYWATPEFYMTAQFSKFIRAGAYRIGSTPGSADTVSNVAFLNPDQSLVIVVVNQTETEQAFRIVADGRQISASLPCKSVATYVWEPVDNLGAID
ncbi:glycosyl hydrolase [Paenibacillaceae bacterium]|nr:glycosyl hydrolase [Paenibacillaceae bacterium]